MKKGLIFSGVQPTGNLHLGNYLGAIKNWVAMQNDYNCIYGIMDLHAITVPQEPEKLRASILETAAALIASGINPETNLLVVQSTVPAHAELAWILNCHTPLGWLNRMTQFKEKAGKHRENAVLGLYSYPVLMAADILTYKATHVPVGEDQKQHLELARDIAGAFNRQYEQDIFPLPEPVIIGEATRVMSLRDGTKKMSKSDSSDQSRINLTDSEDQIADKFKRATTDSIEGVSYDPENRPHVSNLVNIFTSLSGQSREQICTTYATAQFSVFKKDLADLAADKIGKITTEMNKLMQDKAYLESLLRSGAEKAMNITGNVMSEVRSTVGLPDF